MVKSIRKEMKVEVAKPESSEKVREPQKAKGKAKKLLPLWNFPLQGRSVRARNLAEATKKINAKK